MSKKTIGFLLGVAVLWPVSSPAEVINRVVATVDGEPITLHEVRAFRQQARQLATLVPQEGIATMSEQDLLEALIMNKLVSKEVEAQGLKAKESDIDSYIERIKAQNNLTDEQLQQALASQGLTMESYRKQIADEIGRALLINREIGARVNVTRQDIERYYKEHEEEFARPEQIRVRHIFLPIAPTASADEEKEARVLIEEIHRRAVAGEDFAVLADTYSQGPGAGQGGDLGYFKRGQMAPEIEEVAFSLKPGEVSRPFRTGAGLHLLKVEEYSGAGKKELTPEVAEEIKRKLYNEALRRRYERWFQEDLRFRHHVETFLTAPPGSPTGVSSSTARARRQEETTASRAAPAQERKEQKGFFRRLLPF
ncbi:MAG: peptidylprolyl isomerase [Candidatus Binatia bacterium]|nr:peptidylprolyl isomerase [Candidatus Binatia bacterium]